MNDNASVPAKPNVDGASPAQVSSSAALETSRDNGEPAAECQRLRERIVELEIERDRLQGTVKNLERDYQEMHHAYWVEVRKQYTEEELREFAQVPDMADCRPLSDILHELEEIVQGEDAETKN